jgi:hypothetical protein
MAAFDTFHSFNGSLSDEQRKSLGDFIKRQTDELLAARSEDARIRIVDRYLQEVHGRLEERKIGSR